MASSKLQRPKKSATKPASKSAAKKPSKPTAKKSVASASKPSPKPAEPKMDVTTLEVAQSELARCLGLASQNVATLVQTGTLRKSSSGKFPLVESVSAYCRSLRERKAGSNKSDLELENIALKNERLKEQLRSWRMQRDREVAMAILEAQRNTLQKLREECKLVPALVEAIDEYIGCIDRTDIEQISCTVEGEQEDEDE